MVVEDVDLVVVVVLVDLVVIEVAEIVRARMLWQKLC